MEFLRNIWWRLQAMTAAKILAFPDDDEIYPVHALDNTTTNRHYLYRLMLFNDVLDADKLHSSLCALLDSGDWRKLGGRLRLSGRSLQLSVPKTFTPKRPPITYSHADYSELNINDHALGKRLPRQTDETTLFPISSEFAEFAISPEWPSTFSGYLHTDRPQMSLRITSFKDATVVSLLYPHTMMDATGHQAFLRAWSSVLSGRPSEIPIVLGARDDITVKLLNEMKEKNLEELVMEKQRLKGWDLILFMVRFVWDSLWRPVNDTRMFRMTKMQLEKLKTHARKQAMMYSSKSDEDCFISEADVLTAWIAWSILRTSEVTRPLTIASLINMRFRLPLHQPDSVYLQNLLFVAYAGLKLSNSQGSVGELALLHRKALAQQTSKTQAWRWLQTLYESSKKGKQPQLFFGDRDAITVIVNNLCKIDILKTVDFSSAVVRTGEANALRKNPTGTMYNCYTFPMKKNRLSPRCCWLLGADHAGSMWIMASLQSTTWQLMEKDLQQWTDAE